MINCEVTLIDLILSKNKQEKKLRKYYHINLHLVICNFFFFNCFQSCHSIFLVAETKILCKLCLQHNVFDVLKKCLSKYDE